jgi:hypothetical protein
MLAVEIKGSDLKYAWEVVAIYHGRSVTIKAREAIYIHTFFLDTL